MTAGLIAALAGSLPPPQSASGRIALDSPDGQNSGTTSTARKSPMASSAAITPMPPAVISAVARRSRP